MTAEPATYSELVIALQDLVEESGADEMPEDMNICAMPCCAGPRALRVLARADTTRAQLERDVVDAAIELPRIWPRDDKQNRLQVLLRAVAAYQASQHRQRR
jgi:hypothetical protein